MKRWEDDMSNERRARGLARRGLWVLAIVLAGCIAMPVFAGLPAGRRAGAMRGSGEARGMRGPG